LGFINLVPLSLPLPDIEQDGTLKKLQSDRLTVPFKNSVDRKPKPYPTEYQRKMWPRIFDTKLTVDEWRQKERKRVVKVIKAQQAEEANYQEARKRIQFAKLLQHISGLKAEFKEYILNGRDPEGMSALERDSALNRYDFFRSEQLFIGELIKAATNRYEGEPSPTKAGILARWFIDEEDRFQVEFPRLVKAFSDDQVMISRIRLCANKNCDLVFWAGRVDQLCCTPECNHARHSQLTRERRAQGYYQGARLTEKEKLQLAVQKRERSSAAQRRK
jgi:hypothetical protein